MSLTVDWLERWPLVPKPNTHGAHTSEMQKDYFCPVSIFLTEKCPNHALWEVCHNLRQKSKHRLVFYHYLVIWSLIVWFCIHFSPNMLRLMALIWKCPDFLAEMSGILDTRIPTYCNSATPHRDYLYSPRVDESKIRSFLQLLSCTADQGKLLVCFQPNTKHHYTIPSYREVYTAFCMKGRGFSLCNTASTWNSNEILNSMNH